MQRLPGVALLLLAACHPDPDLKTETGDSGEVTWGDRFEPFVDALLADLDASDAYGVSAAIMEAGEVTFAFGFGSADEAGTVPVDRDTLFQIGSTTKMMTATRLLMDVEAGRITLDQSLGSVLPELEFRYGPTWDDQILLQHLLTHQGAFYDWIDWAGSSSDSELAEYTYGTYDDEFFLMADPGMFWNYSNPNFIMAGLITETLDTRPWPDIMQQDLFQPLGMDRTWLRRSEVEADGHYSLSVGYGTDVYTTGGYGHVAMDLMPDPGWARPAGLVWTTPAQMMTWARFLMQGDATILADDLRESMVEEHVNTLYYADELHYGYGVMVERGYLTGDDEYYVMPVWEHGGNTLSFTSIFYMLPQQDFAISILSSAYGTDFYDSLDAALTTLVDLPAPQEPPEYPWDPDKLDKHVGSYQDTFNIGRVYVTREGDTLFVDCPDLAAYGYDVTPELVPFSSDIFYVEIDGDYLDLTFIQTEEGGMSQYIRNRSFVTTRVADDEDPPPFQVRPERMRRLLTQARLQPAPGRPRR